MPTVKPIPDGTHTVIASLTVRGWARGPAWISGLAALLVMLSHAGLAIYIGWWELVGFRSWTY